MPTASREIRKKRRLKRELSLAYRLLEVVTTQRDQMRTTAQALQQELKKYTDPSDTQAATPIVYGSVAAQLEADKNLSPEAKGDYTSGV